MKMKLLKKVCLLMMICAMMLGASSLLTACANQSGMNTTLTANETVEPQPVVNDPEYEVKSYDSFLSYGHGLFYEEVDPSDRRSTDELPAEYTQIEYIETTGKQWIDTGYITNSETQIEAKFFIPTNFGVTNDVSTSSTTVLSGPLLSYSGFHIGNRNYSNSNVPLRENMINEIFLSANSYILTAGGTEYVNLSFSATINYTKSLKLFLGDSTRKNYYVLTKSGVKLYSLKISEKDSTTGDVTYVRDLVPCVKDNETGLFDVVEQKFYTNEEGNGSFNIHNDLLGSGTENDPYQISSIQDLLAFNGFANGDEYYVVTNDIIFNDGYFERISDGTCTYHDGGDGILYDWNAPSVYFRKFDGQNHKFKNFYSSQMGLFNVFKHGEFPYDTDSSRLSVLTIEVSNIEVVNAYFTDNNAVDNISSILLSTHRNKLATVVSNCKIDAYIYFSNSTRGAFIHSSKYPLDERLTITNCVSRGSLIAYAGYGISVNSWFDVSSDRIGKFSNCVNYANITARESAAGIIQNVGRDRFRSFAYMDSCKNYGNITGFSRAGGIGASDDGEYKNCYNYGKVVATNTSTMSDADSQASGIIVAPERQARYLNYKFYSCYNEGDVNACYASAGIFCSQTSPYKGWADEQHFEKCVNKGNIFSSSKNRSCSSSGIANYVRTAKNCVNYGYTSTNGSSASNYSSGLFCSFVTTSGLYIENCVNYSTITSGSSSAYGIIATVATSGNSVIICGCRNYGAINGRNSAGGICGVGSNVKLTISECVNYGDVLSSNGPVAGVIMVGGGNNHTTIINIERCGNFGTLEGKSVGGIESGGLSSASCSIRNCISAGEIKHKDNASFSCYPLYSTSEAGVGVVVKNCIADCKVLNQQTRQFWGDDFSGFFLNRRTGKIGLKTLESVGSFMIPISSASYLENDLNFIKMN